MLSLMPTLTSEASRTLSRSWWDCHRSNFH